MRRTLALALTLSLTLTLYLTRTSCAFGGVMGGCVFGNVSSPLGDTAVLSAMVSRCGMMAHVGSQATYTLLVAALALLLGALP